MARKTTEILTAEDVTPEILSLVYSVVDGWYSDISIDSEDMLDRLENYSLLDGSYPDFGSSVLSPAISKIMRCARKYKKDSL